MNLHVIGHLPKMHLLTLVYMKSFSNLIRVPLEKYNAPRIIPARYSIHAQGRQIFHANGRTGEYPEQFHLIFPGRRI
jgi:hypothetical protein